MAYLKNQSALSPLSYAMLIENLFTTSAPKKNLLSHRGWIEEKRKIVIKFVS